MNKFWMCYADNHGGAKVVHSTLKEAREEASRIAQKELCKVYILECIGYCAVRTCPITFTPIK